MHNNYISFYLLLRVIKMKNMQHNSVQYQVIFILVPWAAAVALESKPVVNLSAASDFVQLIFYLLFFNPGLRVLI